MGNIIEIKGKVKYSITLDPGVWIFDDRKLELNSYFASTNAEEDHLEEYTKSISKHWDREIMEGAIYPPTLKTEKKFEKEKVLTGTFCIQFKPFLLNSEPEEDATHFIIESENGNTQISLEQAKDLVLGFSMNGKPLNEDGPVHVYFGDGSNKEKPIKRVKAFRVE